MAKKIKFPLEMKDGVQVRTIEELKENFDIEKAMEYLLDGKLQTWLSDRYYIQEAEEVGDLDVYESDTENKLYMILGIDNQEKDTREVNVEALEHRKQKLLRLKEFTDDESLWDKVEFVAFDQEELADLLDEECKTIYLCGEKFQVPYSVGNVAYIGINEPEVFINAVGKIDLEVQGISFEGVKLLNEDIETGEELYNLGLSYLWGRNGKENSVEKAMEYFLKASKKGNADAMARFAWRIADNDWYEKYNLTRNEVKELIENSINSGSTIGINCKAERLWFGDLYEEDIDNAKELIIEAFNRGEPSSVSNRHYIIPSNQLREKIDVLEKGVKLKSAWAANKLGIEYYNGNELLAVDKEKAHKYFELAMEFEESGYPEDGWGIRNCAVDYCNGDGVEKDVKKGIGYLKKACCEKYVDGGAAGDAAKELAALFFIGEHVEKDIETAYRYAELGRKWGNACATFLAGRIQCEKASMESIKEGVEKLLHVANEETTVCYATKLIKSKMGEDVIVAQIAEGGFYYVIYERTGGWMSIDREIRVNFIGFDDIYMDRINKEQIMVWNADIMMATPECKMVYYDKKVYLAMAVLSEGLFCVINTNTREVVDRRPFEHNSFLGELEIREEKEEGNTYIVYGTSGGKLNKYSCK